jgi:hypothetical protein
MIHHITKAENKLFKKWAQDLRKKGILTKSERIYEDGIPFPEIYSKCRVKTVFVLREPNFDDEHHYYDLREAIKKSNNGVEWWEQRVGPLCRAILPCATGDKEPHEECLRYFGYIQLKKIGGGPQATPGAIMAAVERDAELLREQFNIYKPDIVIACGLGRNNPFSLLENVLFAGQCECLISRIRPRQCTKRTRGGKTFYILEAHHPSARSSKEMRMEELANNFYSLTKLGRS